MKKDSESNKKEYVWVCDFCGKEFKTKKESDHHELKCKKKQKIKFYLKRFSLRFLLSILASLLFFVITLPFVIGIDTVNFLKIDNIYDRGEFNIWIVVFVFGILTLFTSFITFLKKHFRLTSILLIVYWLLGAYFVATIGYLDKETQGIIIDKDSPITMMSDRIKCDEQNAITNTQKCTYLISSDDSYYGTGVGIGNNYIVTNRHVIEDSKEIKIKINGSLQKATLWNYSDSIDIAILKVNENIKPCIWFDSSKLKLAENLYAIGWANTPDGEATITKGIFSKISETKDGSELVQTDTPINPGNSGGPLLNECGIVGINTTKEFWSNEDTPRPLEGLGNALSSKILAPVIEQLIKEGSEKTKTPKSPKVTMNKIPTSSSNIYIKKEDIQGLFNPLTEIKKYYLLHKNEYSKENMDQLFDLIDRQLAFCETLLNRLDDNKPANKDDLFMWQSILKMANETQSILDKI